MGLVKALPTGAYLRLRHSNYVGNFGDRGSSPKLDEAPIGRIPQQDIGVIHDATVSIRALLVNVSGGHP